MELYKDTNIDRERLLEYAQQLVNEKLKKEGKLLPNVERTYVMYLRKSTKGKKRQERSIPDQRAECQKLVKDLGLKLIETLIEKESAKKAGKRDEFYVMLDNVRRGKYNSILAWHPDRLARNMKDAGEIMDLLDRNKLIDLKFPTYMFSKDANGMMALGMQFVLAKQYSDNLSVSSSRGSKRKAMEGKATKPKYGYVLDKHRHFRIDEHSFELLKEAFQMGLNGVSLEKIATYLNSKKFLYDGNQTKVTKQKLSSIFTDPFYAGIYIFGSEIINLPKVDPSFKQMITALDFLDLRNLQNEARGYKKVRTTGILFSKMVNCSYCNNLMTPGKSESGTGKRYLYLYCTNKRCITHLDKKKLKRQIRSKMILDFVYGLLSKLRIDKKAYEAYITEAQSSLVQDKQTYIEELRSIPRAIADIDKNINNLSLSLSKAKEGEVTEEINNKIATAIEEKNDYLKRKEIVTNSIIAIERGIRTDTISYEKFLNFFNNIVGILQNSDNVVLVDKMLRMIFLNFTVDNEKVTSYQLNPTFEKYAKIDSVILGRGLRTRTADLTVPNRAFYQLN